MIQLNKEFYSSPYFFLLEKKNNKYFLSFSSESTIVEAKKNLEIINIPKKDIEKVIFYLKKVANSDKKKNTKEIKSELDELVSTDGTMSNSKIPILDPRLHPRKTMDQSIVMGAITNDPISRGYRTYYGESIEEIDLSKAYGNKETSGKTPIQTIKVLDKMGVDNPVERANEMGKDPKLNRKKKRNSTMRIRLIEKETIDEIQKQKMIKMVEDIITKRKTDSSEIRKKDTDTQDIPFFIKKNIKSLMKQSEKYGLTKSELIKLMKDE